jgi:HAE1 family hydrophobic/amphiphilic exporter-1
MTSFAFIFGMIPLWVATGAGAISRQILGTVVIAGMLVATAIAIFIIPVLFVLLERLANRKGREQPAAAHEQPAAPHEHPAAPLPTEPEATR